MHLAATEVKNHYKFLENHITKYWLDYSQLQLLLSLDYN